MRTDAYSQKRKQSYKRKREKELPLIGGAMRRIRSSKSLVECNPPCNRALTIFFCRVRQLLSSPYSLRIRPTSESGQEFNMSSALRLACHRPVHQFNRKENLCITLQQMGKRISLYKKLVCFNLQKQQKYSFFLGLIQQKYYSLL